MENSNFCLKVHGYYFLLIFYNMYYINFIREKQLHITVISIKIFTNIKNRKTLIKDNQEFP